MEDKISLGQDYGYVYLCEALGCTNYYGSDEEELDTHICPDYIANKIDYDKKK